jgi:hypothetical protein
MKYKVNSQMKSQRNPSLARRRTRRKLLLLTLLCHENLNLKWMIQMIRSFGSLLLEIVGTMMMGKTDGSPLQGRMV